MDYSLALLSPVADSKTDSRDGRQQAKNGGRERQRKGDLSTEVTGRDKERREVPKVGLEPTCTLYSGSSRLSACPGRFTHSSVQVGCSNDVATLLFSLSLFFLVALIGDQLV
jgi:hypothetical protein